MNSVAQELLFRMLPDGVAGSDEELIEQLELLEGMSLVGRCIVSNAGVGGGYSDDGECISGVESLWAFKNVLHQQVRATAWVHIVEVCFENKVRNNYLRLMQCT
jgi:hypothetical protein